MIFNNIIGNEQNKELLKQVINNDNIAHSYMFIGQDSIGKLLFATEFAKAILCSGSIKPCNTCKSCIEFDTSNNPDFKLIIPDGNNIKIEQIREITKDIYAKPIASSKKVYIIDDSNLMTKEAQNSLLKTLEEPPEYAIIILIATNENLFLPTIKSRCTKINFNKLSNEQLTLVLNEKYNYFDIPKLVFKIADGSVAKAIEVKDKEKEYENVQKVFSNLEEINIIDLINIKDELFKDKEEANKTLEYINLIFFDKVKSNLKYVKCMKIVEDTKDRLKKNSNFDMAIDNFIITVWEEING